MDQAISSDCAPMVAAAGSPSPDATAWIRALTGRLAAAALPQTTPYAMGSITVATTPCPTRMILTTTATTR